MDDEGECSKCKTFSSKSNFHEDITKIYGYRPKCINCTKQYHYKKREKRNLRERRRLAIHVNFRLIKSTRRRFHMAVNRNTKSLATRGILGIDVETYGRWIEWQMIPEMNWSVIEIDHVMPICMFNVSKDDELKEAFSWKNTQSLIKEVHSQKRINFNFIDYQFQFIRLYQFLKLKEEGLQ